MKHLTLLSLACLTLAACAGPGYNYNATSDRIETRRDAPVPTGNAVEPAM